jgi:hypothetical protein
MDARVAFHPAGDVDARAALPFVSAKRASVQAPPRSRRAGEALRRAVATIRPFSFEPAVYAETLADPSMELRRPGLSAARLRTLIALQQKTIRPCGPRGARGGSFTMAKSTECPEAPGHPARCGGGLADGRIVTEREAAGISARSCDQNAATPAIGLLAALPAE